MADSPPDPSSALASSSSSSAAAAAAAADLSQSGLTIRSDSETYDAPSSNALLSSPRLSSDSPSPLVVLYTPPTLWGLLRGAAINLVLPFINGLMLGFGELFAHEIAFRLGWSGTKVFPRHRETARRAGPGIEVRDDPVTRRRRSGEEMNMYTSLE